MISQHLITNTELQTINYFNVMTLLGLNQGLEFSYKIIYGHVFMFIKIS